MKDLPNGCFVIVAKEAGATQFLGIVKGVAAIEQPMIGRMMIVECTDGTIPNSNYEYCSISVPEIFLTRL